MSSCEKFFSPRRLRLLGTLLGVSVLSGACTTAADDAPETEPPAPVRAERLEATVLERYDFDSSMFTQGLEVHQRAADDAPVLLVGTGRYGESALHVMELGSSQPQASYPIDPAHFGEGITQTPDAVWQLTWQEGVVYRRDPVSLEIVETLPLAGEGWGLCYLPDAPGGPVLVLSDGTATLRLMDPETFEHRSSLTVALDGEQVGNINELECVSGPGGRSTIYANIWFSPQIIRIDPATGEVTAVINTDNLERRAQADPDNVLNGIAHVPGTDEFLLTGKRWPDIYRVRFEPR